MIKKYLTNIIRNILNEYEIVVKKKQTDVKAKDNNLLQENEPEKTINFLKGKEFYTIKEIAEAVNFPPDSVHEYLNRQNIEKDSIIKGMNLYTQAKTDKIIELMSGKKSHTPLNSINGNKLLTVQQIAVKQGVSYSHTLKMLHQNKIKPYKIKGKKYLYKDENFDNIFITSKMKDKKIVNKKGYYSWRDISKITGYSKTTIYAKINVNQIPFIRRGGIRYFKKADVDYYFDLQTFKI